VSTHLKEKTDKREANIKARIDGKKAKKMGVKVFLSFCELCI
jgi:hypothetical protein